MNTKWLNALAGTVQLTDLVGEGFLTGAEFGSVTIQRWCGDESAGTISFTLDGVTYTAQEDPDDGYRSAMESLKASVQPLKNFFAPVRVIGRMEADTEYENNDVLQLINAATGEIILEVGTGNTGDYYPYFVARFNPENI